MAKKAIVLRGPPAIGKTCIKDCFLRKVELGDEVYLNLDHGHADQIGQKAGLDVLIIELAYGEIVPPPIPPGLPPGLTRDPKQWVDAVRSQDREIYCFLLYADWPRDEERIRKKWRDDTKAQHIWPTADAFVQAQKPYHDFYRTPECKDFPRNASLAELTLDFDKSADEMADYILKECGFSGLTEKGK
jgi:hypothetical protein